VFLTVFDSLKILPFTVEQVANAFNLPIKKGSIDYDKSRPVGYQMDDNEIDYLKKDCTIMAMALHVLFGKNLTAMTTGSNAVKHFKEIFNEKRFDRLFPKLDYNTDQDIRHSYRGGFTYLTRNIKIKLLKMGSYLM
jgi:hypothetical protein